MINLYKKMRKDALALALKKLSYRAYSQKQLETYLDTFEFSREQIEAVMIKLQNWGYLDDQKLAYDWYEYLLNKPYGYSYIYSKFQEKGIPQQIINSVLADYDEKKELELARGLAKKFISGKLGQEPGSKIREKLARHLYRKGFSRANILNIISNIFPESP